MSLEGNLRDLALNEVCQLLAHTRKSGELRLVAPLAGLRATISFDAGAIVGATILGSAATSLAGAQEGSVQEVERITLEVLTWNEGTFRFLPAEQGAKLTHTGVRLNTELILMEGARRSGEWARLSDRLPSARAIPAFADIEAGQLPLLNLTPQQWEVLTGVDGQRDLPALARSLGRDLLDVAEIVHELIGTGLLRLVDSARALRTQPTPPSSAIQEADIDLWVPSDSELLRAQFSEESGDEVFDPVRVGVTTPEGLPRLRTPVVPQRSQIATSQIAVTTPATQLPASARELGDAAARRGDLAAAMAFWNTTLECGDSPSDALHAREAIVLAARLQKMLYVNRPE